MKKNSSTGRHARECLFPVGNPGASAPRQRPAIVPFFLPFEAAHIVASFALKTSRRGTRDLLIAYHTHKLLPIFCPS